MTRVNPQIQALVDEEALSEEEPGPPSLETIRAGYLRTAIELGGPVEPVAAVEDVVIPRPDGSSLAARVYRPSVPAGRAGALVWFHGGGWVSGDLEGFDRVARQLANASGAVCISVDYRLAPEHPFPAAVEDAHAALAWASGHGADQLGTDPRLVIAGGDSAGGQLAVLAVRAAPPQTVLAQLLVYPALDPDMDSDAYRVYAGGPMLTAEDMRACWAAYLGDRVAESRLLGPDVPLAGMPPAWIVIAEHDPLRDDGLRYAAALRAAGVSVETVIYDDMTHGFLRWGGIVERAREAIAFLGDAARRELTPSAQ